MEPLAIEAHDLTKRFGDLVALAGVSLSVAHGEVFGLLGPNGAGKTTLVRILTTVLVPDGGRAIVAGADLIGEPDVVRRRIGLAGQFAAVDPRLSARENLEMVGRLCHLGRRRARERAGSLLEAFGLAGAADRPLRTYSGGMRRRLDLAAALVAEPPVLFLDEPTTGLDPESRLALWAIVADLAASGTTVLLTTQYLEEADRLAERLVIVDHGRIVAEGTPASLKARLGATVVEVRLAAEPPPMVVEALRAAGFPDPRVDGRVVELGVENGAQAAMIALRALDGAGVAIEGMVIREPTLDDVFLAITNGQLSTEGAA
ncbi:daunorubicin resistance ABC transporter ATPase subunit [Acidimicrobium ferrooxidans DSM 10331]|uniref:Daunorubicin resistance ABC transporter ATPase subunit n=1 Tax=Acidimicrobium ferrooxidans (strain DSM 10331 / JCM 15462 / NBRC 103882 / ICP) TaxID=525909 RepID=C7M1P3_ACIFD|nr:daunorubicin resistance protein DrrA family ABC transporter ATP-binding protein [Acidimicrobium ferrooxidans]ACU54790.1 daunorubicin resistance ABC transporter ATPase subunit [Acidimicrobium ferrooxidans DSM 10331]